MLGSRSRINLQVDTAWPKSILAADPQCHPRPITRPASSP